MSEEAGSGEVTQAVLRDISNMPADLAKSGLSAVCLAMARLIDGPGSPTSKSMCARSLLDGLDRLRELTPATVEGDGLDDLATRRSARLAGAAGI